MQRAAAADVESVDFGVGLEQQLGPLLEVVESALVQWGRAGLEPPRALSELGVECRTGNWIAHPGLGVHVRALGEEEFEDVDFQVQQLPFPVISHIVPVGCTDDVERCPCGLPSGVERTSAP